MSDWVWVSPSWHRLTGGVLEDDKLEGACGVRIPREAAMRPDPEPPVQDRCPNCDALERSEPQT